MCKVDPPCPRCSLLKWVESVFPFSLIQQLTSWFYSLLGIFGEYSQEAQEFFENLSWYPHLMKC